MSTIYTSTITRNAVYLDGTWYFTESILGASPSRNLRALHHLHAQEVNELRMHFQNQRFPKELGEALRDRHIQLGGQAYIPPGTAATPNFAGNVRQYLSWRFSGNPTWHECRDVPQVQYMHDIDSKTLLVRNAQSETIEMIAGSIDAHESPDEAALGMAIGSRKMISWSCLVTDGRTEEESLIRALKAANLYTPEPE